jgi:hypothetical protein
VSVWLAWLLGPCIRHCGSGAQTRVRPDNPRDEPGSSGIVDITAEPACSPSWVGLKRATNLQPAFRTSVRPVHVSPEPVTLLKPNPDTEIDLMEMEALDPLRTLMKEIRWLPSGTTPKSKPHGGAGQLKLVPSVMSLLPRLFGGGGGEVPDVPGVTGEPGDPGDPGDPGAPGDAGDPGSSAELDAPDEFPRLPLGIVGAAVRDVAGVDDPIGGLVSVGPGGRP